MSAKKGKRYIKLKNDTSSEKSFPLAEVVSFLKKESTTKFDETIDLAINTGLNPKHADQMLRGVAPLPAGLGKETRVAVFAKGPKADEAKKAGADIVGDEDLLEAVKAGNIDFDRCIATPDMMAKVGQLGRILGTKGLMPNPKLGTVTMDVTEAVKAAKAGQVEYKVDKNGVVHAGVGKVSFSNDDIERNIRAFFELLYQSKPSGAKGVYLKKATLSTTMGPGIALDIQSLSDAA